VPDPMIVTASATYITHLLAAISLLPASVPLLTWAYALTAMVALYRHECAMALCYLVIAMIVATGH
jgi:hypothetical protein